MGPTPGGTATVTFAYHAPSGETIRAQGDRVVGTAGDVDGVALGVQRQHQVASEGVIGVIARDMPDAPAPMLHNANQLMLSAVSGGGTLRWFGDRVVEFDEVVARLNRQAADAADDGSESATGILEVARQLAYQVAVETVEAHARSAASMLRDPLADDTVRRLFAAGALPISTPVLFGDVDLGEVDLAHILDVMAATGRLPDGVDPDSVRDGFDAVRDVLDREDFGSNGNRDDLERMIDVLDDLTGPELTIMLEALSDDDLRSLGDLTNDTGDSGWKWWDHNGLEHWDRIDFDTMLLSQVAPATAQRLVSLMDGRQPGFSTTDTALDGRNPQTGDVSDGLSWQVPDDPSLWPVDADGNPVVSSDQVSQGQIGDCWFIASLSATSATDPDFFPDHVTTNDNGTVTVTMYDSDGNPHPVTVTNDLPTNSDGSLLGAHDPDGDSHWAAYYEKAFAQAYHDDEGGAPDGKGGDPDYDRAENGTYAGIEWDYTDAAPPYVTGHDGDGVSGFDGVREAYEDGHPVIVASNSEDDAVPDDQRGAYHTRHVYFVKGFDDDEVILGNPWGSDYPDVRMDADDFEKNFHDPRALEVEK